MGEVLDCDGEMVAHLPIKLERGTDVHAALCSLIQGNKREVSAGTLLKLEGEETSSIFLVISGWLLVSKSLADGQRQIIDVVLPGGIVEPASADPATSVGEIEALTDVNMAVISRTNWRQACIDYPELAKLIHNIICAALSRISERMLRLGKGAAETTIAYTLCELCLRSTEHGLIEEKGFHIPMTQQQLGDLCGLSAVHICRTLRRLERTKVLTVTDHMDIVVHDMEALAEIAEIDPETLRNEIIPAA